MEKQSSEAPSMTCSHDGEVGEARPARPRDFSNGRLLERAFELAGTAGIGSVSAIRSALLREGYSNFEVNQLALRSLSRQLQGHIRKARRKPQYQSKA
jgi:hypothetical protein